MNIVRRQPSSLSAFRPRAFDDAFGRLVETMFEDMFAPSAEGNAALSPRLNVSESEQAFEIQAEMPGINKEDVKVSVEHQRVTIEGESKRETERREGANLLYAERGSSRYVRSFMLPAEVDEGSAQARMEDGVLTLTLPKKQGGAGTRIAIQ